MGLFGKIKNILFEDEEEVEETMPVFTKEEVKAEKKEEEHIKEEEPIKVTPGSRFKNVKRDIDLSFDEKDVLDEVVNSYVAEKNDVKVEEKEVKEEVKEESKSPFLPFDEDEFDRLNSRINKNEEKARRKDKEMQKEKINYQETARRANNNYSSTTTNRDRLDHNFNNVNMFGGKKPFKPSPVISPVYGILDKNYKKDDIVDRSNPNDIVRIKREKVKVEHIQSKEENTHVEEVKHNEIISHKEVEEQHDIDLDYVRKKAYGSRINNVNEDESKKQLDESDTFKDDVVGEVLEKDNSLQKPQIEESVNLFKEDSTVEDLIVPVSNDIDDIDDIDDDASVEDIIDFHEEDIVSEELPEEDEIKKEKDISDLILDDINKDEEDDDVVVRRGKALEDLEKTSTLQILDDIEKELNSIKPISKGENDNNNGDDTLEDDLFNLIDSMYEGGEDEDD